MGKIRFQIARAIVYFLAFVVPPMMLGTLLTFSAISELLIHKRPPPFDLKSVKVLHDLREGAARAPAPASALPVALIVTSNVGTEVTDLLGSYEILSESGKFRVLTAAARKEISPTTSDLAVLPDTTFKEAPEADLLVIPAILDESEMEVVNFVAERAARAKLVVALGEGARVLARAGLLKRANATSHFIAVPELRKLEPLTQWVRGPRYVADGKMVTSVGASASMDAMLYAIERLSGAESARHTADALAYHWLREEDPTEPAKTPLDPGAATRSLVRGDFWLLFLHGGYDWSKKLAGVLIYPGMSELSLAAILDTFPRTLGTRVTTAAGERVVIQSRHGMSLVPASKLEDVLLPDLLVVPSGMGPRGTPPPLDPLKDPTVHRWIVDRNVSVKSFLYEAPGHALSKSFALLSQLVNPDAEAEGSSIVRFVAKMIEYPTSELKFDHKTQLVWPGGQMVESSFHLPLWAKPLAIGLMGLMLAIFVDRRLSLARARAAAAAAKRKR